MNITLIGGLYIPMKNILIKILGYVIGIIGVIVVLPFGLVYFLISVFWKIFGTSVISFIILMLMGLNMEDCFKYSAGLGLFIGICLKYNEIKKG